MLCHRLPQFIRKRHGQGMEGPSKQKKRRLTTFQWYPEVLHFCPTTPLILVGLKSDLRTKRTCIDLLKTQGLTPVTPEQGQAVANRMGLPTRNVVRRSREVWTKFLSWPSTQRLLLRSRVEPIQVLRMVAVDGKAERRSKEETANSSDRFWRSRWRSNHV